MRFTMQTHLDDTTLDTLVDGELPVEQAADVARHLESCVQCRARADSLRMVMSSLAALPRAIHPEEDLLPGIRARLTPRNASEGRAAAVEAQPSRKSAGMGWVRPWRLAAAAVLVAMVSSAVTVAVMRSRGGAENGTLAGPEPSGGLSAELLASDPELARLSLLEAEYVRAAEELARAFGARAVALDPETRALVEGNLATIDRAIADVRRALEAAPASEPLRMLLLASHERKLDFLRRASELTL
jgi:hypothetical protein